jgi:hypothetical protein
MMSKQEVRRTRIITFVISSLTLLTLIAFIFAFIQQAEAKRQVQISVELAKQVATVEQELLKCRLENKSH